MADRSDEEIRIAVLTKLYRRKLWGKSYTTVENALSKIPVHQRDRGRRCVDTLVKEGLLILHKNGACVSLNPVRKEEIQDILSEVLPDYFL